jgi:excisionase family DNA binding protein
MTRHPTNAIPSEVMTTEEVIAFLRVNTRTLYRLIRSGNFPAVRVGRQWRFRRSDLEAWLDRDRPVY